MPINNELATKIWYRYAYCRDNGHIEFVKKADMCERFFEGKQWEDADLMRLRAARRPALTINKIISTISNVMGEQIFNRSEISYRPKSGAPEENADVLNKVFKFIADNNQLEWLRSDLFADGIITSRGFLDMRMDFSESLSGDIKIELLNPKNVIVDPDAEQYDPDTWNEVFTSKWMTIDDIELLYGKDDADILRVRNQSFFPYGYDSIDFYRDRFGLSHVPSFSSEFSPYLDPVLRNHRVIERQHRVLARQLHFADPRTGETRPVPDAWGKRRTQLVAKQFGLEIIPRMVKRIRWTVISDNVVLHDDFSPYKHFTVIPYFPYFRRGRTIGLVENLIGPQELLNKVSSQELHVVNTTANSGYKVKTGALTTMTVEELEARGAETGLVIEVNGDPEKDVVKIAPNQVPQGLDRISYKAEEHIKTISNVPDSVMGQDRADVAAKAIQQKRQAASTNQAKPMDSLERTDFMIARNALDLIQEFWTDEKVLTVTHDAVTGETEQLPVNQVQPDGTVLNDLTLGEYSITITSVPARETLEDSQFDQAMAMREAGIGIPDAVLIKSSRLMDKHDIISQLQSASQSPEAQQQQQMALAAQQAELEKTRAETAQKQADAGLKQAKAQKEAITAQKTAQEPPEGAEGGGEDAALMKAQADIDLGYKRLALDTHVQAEKLQLEREKIEAAERARAQQAAQQAVAQRAQRLSNKGAQK